MVAVWATDSCPWLCKDFQPYKLAVTSVRMPLTVSCTATPRTFLCLVCLPCVIYFGCPICCILGAPWFCLDQGQDGGGLGPISKNVIRLEDLGHGATGCVYKAVHATSLQLLAVKEVRVDV